MAVNIKVKYFISEMFANVAFLDPSLDYDNKQNRFIEYAIMWRPAFMLELLYQNTILGLILPTTRHGSAVTCQMSCFMKIV